MGKPKPRDTILVAMFRCFEGDILEDEIAEIFKSILKGNVLLKKDVTYKRNIPSMNDVSRDIKIKRKLKALIVEYLVTKKSEYFRVSNT